MPAESSVIRIKPKKRYPISYIQMPTERPCKTTSTDRSRGIYITGKADFLQNVMKSMATPPGLIPDILTHLASKFNYCVFHEDSMKLTISQVAVLQTLTGMTSRGVERLKSSLSLICPPLATLIPGCIRAELTAFELNDSLEVNHLKESLVVTSSSETRAVREVNWLSRPDQALCK